MGGQKQLTSRRVFLATEVYESQDGPSLLSICLASAVNECYAELDEASLDQLKGLLDSQFLRDEVLSQFGKMPEAKMDRLGIAWRVVTWLKSHKTEAVEVIHVDCVDYFLLENLFALVNAPAFPQLIPLHVGYLMNDGMGIDAAAGCWAGVATRYGLRKHHALADAWALRARFWAVHRGPGTGAPIF